MQLEPRIYLKIEQNLSSDILDTFILEKSIPIFFNVKDNIKEFFTIFKVSKYWNDDIISNIIKIHVYSFDNQIIKYKNIFYIRDNAYISDIPEFNLSIDKAFEDFHECLNNPYEVEYHKGYYLFSDIESFKNFITKMDKNLFYNCNQNVYNEFINNLDTFFKNKLGIFMLKVHLNKLNQK